jgi:hypothetical protein
LVKVASGFAEILAERFVVSPVVSPVVLPAVSPAVSPVVSPVVNPVVLPAVNPVVLPAVNPVVLPVEMLVGIGGQWLRGRHSIHFFRPLRSPSRGG